MRFFASCLILLCFIMCGCGGGGSGSSGGGGAFSGPPSITPNDPSTSPVKLVAVSLPAPTDAEQIDQPADTIMCAPAVAVTLFQMIVREPYSLDVARRELFGLVYFADLANWLGKRGMDVSITLAPPSLARELIKGAIKGGFYVVPFVFRNADRSAPHFLIIYGFDGEQVLMSDSILHDGQHRFSIPFATLQSEWLIPLYGGVSASTPLIFVNRRLPDKTGTK